MLTAEYENTYVPILRNEKLTFSTFMGKRDYKIFINFLSNYDLFSLEYDFIQQTYVKKSSRVYMPLIRIELINFLFNLKFELMSLYKLA